MSKNLKITSILMKTVVIIAAVVGIILSAIQSSEAFMGGSRVFMYFTIQSNIFIALVFKADVRNDKMGIWYVVLALAGYLMCRIIFIIFLYIGRKKVDKE